MHSNLDSIKGKKFSLDNFNNCYNSIKDFYALHGINLKPNCSEKLIDILTYIKTGEIFKIIKDLNFYEINLKDIKYGDLIIFDNTKFINNGLPYHLAVYLTNNDFFHNTNMSRVDYFKKGDIERIYKIYRNKDFKYEIKK